MSKQDAMRQDRADPSEDELRRLRKKARACTHDEYSLMIAPPITLYPHYPLDGVGIKAVARELAVR